MVQLHPAPPDEPLMTVRTILAVFCYSELMRTIKRDIAGALLFSNDGHVLIGKNVKGGVYEDLWVVPAEA